MAELLHKPLLEPDTTLILVTGATGHIASNIVDQALQLGYHVRGTARTQAKAESTVEVHQHNPRYSAVVVEDFERHNEQVIESVKGVHSIIHVAATTDMSPHPGKVIASAVNGTMNLLEAAANESSVRRFTLTSSSTTLLLRQPGTRLVIDNTNWNDEIVDYVWKHQGEPLGPNPYGYVVYGASKVSQERAFWKFVKDRKPAFVCNAIIPDFSTGKTLKGGSAGPTTPWMVNFFETGHKLPITPHWFIDVVDDARIHLIAAVLDGTLTDRRLLAFSGPFNNNDIIQVIRKYHKDWNKAEIDPSEIGETNTFKAEEAGNLLQKWYGHGYRNLEETVLETFPGLVPGH